MSLTINVPLPSRKVRGQFSFVVSDAKSERFMAARDPIGVCPLYYGNDNTGGLWFASEMKVRGERKEDYEFFFFFFFFFFLTFESK